MCTVKLLSRWELAHGVHLRTPICTESHVPHLWVHGMSRDKGLSLRGDRSENAILLEALTVGASAIGTLIETRAADLQDVSQTLEA